MELTEEQYLRIADCLPRQRGNVSLSNLRLLNALLYVLENGCKWRGLPPHFGNWHTIYTRMNRWSKAGGAGPRLCPAAAGTDPVAAPRTGVPGQHGRQSSSRRDRRPKKAAHKPSGAPAEAAPPRFIWLPRMLGAP